MQRILNDLREEAENGTTLPSQGAGSALLSATVMSGRDSSSILMTPVSGLLSFPGDDGQGMEDRGQGKWDGGQEMGVSG